MTQLRRRMLEELERRNYSPGTARCYLHAVQQFAEHFHRPPDQLGARAHTRVSALSAAGAEVCLRRRWRSERLRFGSSTSRRSSGKHMLEHLPFPKLPEKLPTVLSREEVSRLLAASANLMHRTMLMTLYATGVRRAELCQLKTSDIDSQRMVVHIRQGKGGRDRDVPLSPALLEALRAYWRWMKPKTYLFPGLVDGWRSRRADHRQDGLVCLPARGARCRHREARHAAHPSAGLGILHHLSESIHSKDNRP